MTESEIGIVASDTRRGEYLMTTAAQKITLSTSRDIPFDKLMLCQSSVWRTMNGVSVEELAEVIASRARLQSLEERGMSDIDDTNIAEPEY